MTDSMIPFPGPGFDATDQRSVDRFLAALPPTTPNMLPISAFAVKIDGAVEYFRVTRAALEAIAGDCSLSTPLIAQRFGEQIEAQCRALFIRGDGEIDNWTLDLPNLIAL
jgi:hypothetical protein